jgi:hypothetical protein
MVTAATRPEFKLDHGFLDDGNGNLDLSKMESPTFDDFTSEAKWITMLIGAEILRPDLVDGTLTYRRFIEAVGGTMEFDYERFGAQDRTGRFVLESAIEDVREGAIELFDPRGTNPYTIQCGVIGVGASDENGILLNPRYGYPGTENWQKAIGAHTIWIEAKVAFAPDPTTGTQGFTIDMIIHVEDRYNFNPGQADAATGILDKENGRFEVTGQGKEFLSVSTLKRRIEFSMPSGPRVPRQKPPNEKITVPR